MTKHRNLPIVMGVTIGVMLAGAAAASAHYRKHHDSGCSDCGPVAPTTHYSTVQTARSEVRFHDVNVFRHVQRVHQITNVTRIQPILQIHDVTRVHHHTIVETRTAYRSITQHLTPIRIVQHSVQNFYDCHCGL